MCSAIVEKFKDIAQAKQLPVRLGALRQSQSNDFYLKKGFRKTHEEEWDICYEWNAV